MNLFTRALSKIFKSGNQQELNKIKPILQKINDLEPEVSSLKRTILRKDLLFRQISNNGRNSEEILPECFALLERHQKEF